MTSLKYFSYGLWILLSLPFVILCGYVLTGLIFSFESLHYFVSPAFIAVMFHSVVLSFLVAFFSWILGLCLALGFYTFTHTLWQRWYVILLMIAFILQPIILLSVFQPIDFFLHRNALFQSIFIFTLHLSPLSGLAFIYILSTFNALSLQSALAVSSWRYSVKYIMFPALKYFVLALFVLLFILVFIDQAVPSILGYRTYTEDLLAQMTLMENMQAIVLAAFPSYLLVMLLMLLWFGISKRRYIYKEIFSTTHRLHLPFTYVGWTMLFVLIFYLLGLIIALFRVAHALAFDTFIAENIDVMTTSIGFSFVTAFATLMIALLIQYSLKQSARLLQMGLFALLLFYLFVPHALLSLLLLDIYQWLGYFSTFMDYLLFFMGYIFMLLPIALFFIMLLDTVEKEDTFFLFFPVSSFHRWIKIVLPQHALKYVLILFVLMLFSLNELSVSILLIPPGFETMIVKIYNLLHYGDKPSIAFLSLVQLFLVMFTFVLIGWMHKRISP